jgi:hypothetical protein
MRPKASTISDGIETVTMSRVGLAIDLAVRKERFSIISDYFITRNSPSDRLTAGSLTILESHRAKKPPIVAP